MRTWDGGQGRHRHGERGVVPGAAARPASRRQQGQPLSHRDEPRLDRVESERRRTVSEYGVLLIGGKRTHQEAHGPIFADNPQCRLAGVAAEPDEPGFKEGLRPRACRASRHPVLRRSGRRARPRRRPSRQLDAPRGAARRRPRALHRGGQARLHGQAAGRLAGGHRTPSPPPRPDPASRRRCSARTGRPGCRRSGGPSKTAPSARCCPSTPRTSSPRAGRGLCRRAPSAGRSRRSSATPSSAPSVRLFDVGVYSLAWIHMLTGRAVESVFAMTGNYFFADHAAVDVEDFGAMALRLDGGATATAVGGRFGWSSHPRSGPQRVAVIGREGHAQRRGQPTARRGVQRRAGLHAAGGRPRSTLWACGSAESRSTSPCRSGAGPRWTGRRTRCAIDSAHFVDCIDNDVEPDLNAAAAAGIAETILAGYESAARGEEGLAAPAASLASCSRAGRFRPVVPAKSLPSWRRGREPIPGRLEE